jgi:hypothetical protein
VALSDQSGSAGRLLQVLEEPVSCQVRGVPIVLVVDRPLCSAVGDSKAKIGAGIGEGACVTSPRREIRK